MVGNIAGLFKTDFFSSSSFRSLLFNHFRDTKKSDFFMDTFASELLSLRLKSFEGGFSCHNQNGGIETNTATKTDGS